MLNSCNLYRVEFYVNLVDNAHYAINSIGVHLSDLPITRNDYYCFDNFEPQVNNSADRILSDKVNWIKIEGEFIANGDEKYLTIGNFHLDNEIDTFPTDDNYIFGYSYYFIDSISLIKIADETSSAFAGVDTSILLGESVFIGQDVYNLNCTWRTLNGTVLAANVSGIYVQPSETTSYVVEQNLCGNVTYDTVTVSVGYLGLGESAPAPLPSADGGKFEIIPNPNNGNFSLKTYSLEIQELKLIDEIGRQLQILDPKSNVFNLSLPKGIYFLEIKNEGHRVIEKIMLNF